MQITLYQSAKLPYYIGKQTKATKDLLKAEQELQEMLISKKLSLSDYLTKYSSNIELSVVEVDEGFDEADMYDDEDIDVWLNDEEIDVRLNEVDIQDNAATIQYLLQPAEFINTFFIHSR